MDYRPSRAADVPGLKRLWQRCFGDDIGFIDRYFEDLFRPEHLVVCADGAAPVSMVAFLPCALRAPAGAAPCAYLYAMATDPGRQGEGLGQGLLRFAFGYGRARGWAGLTLVPADQGLFRFYAKAGYQTAFSYQTLTRSGPIPNIVPSAVAPVSPAEYRASREGLLAQTVHLDHSLPFLAHFDREARLSGGGLFRLALSGGATGCAAVERSETGSWCAKELLAPRDRLPEALELLAGGLEAGHLTARCPALDPGQAVPFGMACWPPPAPDFQNAYLGLALD